jgi:ubiquinone/menaquinone biosynthesis C-methylase UbiE
MIPRVLEPEVMDTAEDATDYDRMDHSDVNRRFASDFFSACPHPAGVVLDVGTGTAQIPIEMCRQHPVVVVHAIDLADEMLKLATANVAAARLTDRIHLEKANGRQLPHTAGGFAAVVSNSIIHHIPHPFECLGEMVRVCTSGGTLFVRDLLRPSSEQELTRLVDAYAADCNPHQRKLFADSLRAALTLAEVQTLLVELGFDPSTVTQTSDRHWTITAVVT